MSEVRKKYSELVSEELASNTLAQERLIYIHDSEPASSQLEEQLQQGKNETDGQQEEKFHLIRTERLLHGLGHKVGNVQDDIRLINESVESIKDKQEFSSDSIATLLRKFQALKESMSLKELDKLDSLSELKNLGELKNLSELERLDILGKLAELRALDNLRNLSELSHLAKLEQLSKLQDLSKVEALSQLNKLDNLEYLHNLDTLSSLDQLDKLTHLQQLNQLDGLKDLAKLEKLAELRELEKIEDFKHGIAELSRLMPAAKIEELIAKQSEEIKYLERLDQLDQLNKLDHLSELNFLSYLNKLERLQDLSQLDNLQNLKEMDNLKSLARLDRLTELKSLAELSKLDNLSSLGRLDNLRYLECMDDLKSLEDLAQLSQLGKLERLNSLESLEQLSALKKLDHLERLNKLEHLDKLEHLTEMDKLEKIDLLADPKIDKAMDKLNNLPLFKDKFHIYLLKVVANTFVDFGKVIALAAVVIYFLSTHYSATVVSRFMPFLGFSDSSRVNIALAMLDDATGPEDFKIYEDYIKTRVDEQVESYFDVDGLEAMNTKSQLSKLSNLYGYQFKNEKLNMKEYVAVKLEQVAEANYGRFRNLFDYYREKSFFNGDDMELAKSAYIFVINGKYEEALLEFSKMTAIDNDLVGLGTSYSLYKIYQKDPQAAKTAGMAFNRK